MKIYKFKSLTDENKFHHFYQIALKKSIWCATPDSLNDKDEFKFKVDYKPTSETAELLSKVTNKYRNTNFNSEIITSSIFLQKNTFEIIAAPIIKGIIDNCRNSIGIASFSVRKDTEYLWTEYGGNGNGVCIEIEVPDELIGKIYRPVEYVEEKIFHIDGFLKSDLYRDQAFEFYKKVLLTKTKKWDQEEEIRFISKHQKTYFTVDGRITEIIIGTHVTKNTMKKIEDTILNHCRENNIKVIKL